MSTDAMAPLFNIHDLVPQYDNLILIDGRPGTGKSAATAKLITSFIQKYKSDITENAWVIHGGDSKESTTASEKLRDAIQIEYLIDQDYLKSFLLIMQNRLNKTENINIRLRIIY